eukprot:TRINITY_DN14478_c0_g1_i1.p1 TRINITY_DN14478_c0_g1~~TRINITY_DN14478_c0_g1_i1.p1  ORF type:complete len:1735 (+),score=345.60 TRINITY_DN14478_c0_g1_i1:34-5238(+)
MEVEPHPPPDTGFNDPRREWEVLLELARRHEERGDISQGLAVREQMLLAAKAAFGEDSEEVMRGTESFVIRCNQMAMTLLQEGDPDGAFSLLRKAEMLTDKNSSLQSVPAARLKCRAVTLNNLGLFYRHRGQHHAALTYLEQALEIESGTADSHNENPAATLLNLCSVHSSLGRHHVSLKYAKRALASLRRKGKKAAKLGAPIAPSHTSMLAVAHHAIGCQYEGMKVYHKAAAEFVSAVVLARQANVDSSAYKTAYNSVIHKAKLSGKVSEAVLPQLPPEPRDAKRPSTSNPASRGFRHGLPTVHSAPAHRRTSFSTPNSTRPSRPTTAGTAAAGRQDSGALYKQPSLAQQQAAMWSTKKGQPSPYAPHHPPSSNPRLRVAKQAYELIYKPAPSLAHDLSSSHKKALKELDQLSREHLMNAQELVPMPPPPTQPHVPQHVRASPVSQVRMGQLQRPQVDTYAMQSEEPESPLLTPAAPAHSPKASRPQTDGPYPRRTASPTNRSVRPASPVRPSGMALQHRYRDTPLSVPSHAVAAAFGILVAAIPHTAVSEEDTSSPLPSTLPSLVDEHAALPDAIPQDGVLQTISSSVSMRSVNSRGEEFAPPEESQEEEFQVRSPLCEQVQEQEEQEEPQPQTQPQLQLPKPQQQPQPLEEPSPTTSLDIERQSLACLPSPVPPAFIAESSALACVEVSAVAPSHNKELVAKVVALGSKLNSLHDKILQGYNTGGTRIRLEREKIRQVKMAAAVNIQRIWRGRLGKKQWGFKRNEIKEAKARHAEHVKRCNKAACAIQRAWKMYAAISVARAIRQERYMRHTAFIAKSVTCMQCFARMQLARKKAHAKGVSALLSAVHLAQARWRGVDARTKFRKLKSEWQEKRKIIEFGSATRIQGWWRRMLAVRAREECYKEQWEELVSEEKPLFAVGRIKLWWKWMQFEKKFVAEVKRVSMEKERARQVTAQVEYLQRLQYSSAVAVQQAFRRYLAKRQLRYLQITSLESKISYLEHEEKEYAASVLQAFCRVVRAKCSIERRRKEVAEFEALKAWKKEKLIQQEAELQAMQRVERAVIKLQSIWRGHFYRKQDHEKKLHELLEWEAGIAEHATNIIKTWKGYLVRKNVRHKWVHALYITKMVCKIQRAWRISKAKRCLRRSVAKRNKETARRVLEEKQEYSARIIAKALRRNSLSRQEVRVEVVQAFARSKLSTFVQHYNMLVARIEACKKELLAAITIQQWWRVVQVKRLLQHNLNLRALRQQYEKEHTAAVMLQSLWRGTAHRSHCHKFKSAVTIQRFVRRRQAAQATTAHRIALGVSLEHEACIMEYSLLLMQSYCRGKLSRMLCRDVIAERCTQIELHYKKKARRNEMGETRWQAASTVQRAWRSCAAREEAGRRWAMRIVQRVGRGTAARIKTGMAAHCNATVLQQYARAKLALDEVHEMILKRVAHGVVGGIVSNAALIIQQQETRNHAATAIQCALRGCKARRLVVLLRAVKKLTLDDMVRNDAACVMQRFAQSIAASNEIDDRRMRVLRKLEENVQQDAAVLIQACWRMRAVRKQHIQQKQKEKRAACVVSSAIKVNYSKKKSARLRAVKLRAQRQVVRDEAANTIRSLFMIARERSRVASWKNARFGKHKQVRDSDAAAVIQTSWKHHMARVTTSKRSHDRTSAILEDDAAVVIQSFYRGTIGRRFCRRLQAARCIQCAYRSFVARKAVAQTRLALNQLLLIQEAEEHVVFRSTQDTL